MIYSYTIATSVGNAMGSLEAESEVEARELLTDQYESDDLDNPVSIVSLDLELRP